MAYLDAKGAELNEQDVVTLDGRTEKWTVVELGNVGGAGMAVVKLDGKDEFRAVKPTALTKWTAGSAERAE